jgi:hypothetical protein
MSARSTSRPTSGSTHKTSKTTKLAARTRQRIRPETRAEMLERLTNPQITLHEASVILRKCPATVRAYCDAGYLPHGRTSGGQRRFFLRDVLAFLRAREAEKRKP